MNKKNINALLILSSFSFFFIFSCPSDIGDNITHAKKTTNSPATWSHPYGESKYDSAECIIQSSDGNYVFAGIYNGNGSFTNQDSWIVKLDEAGNIIWKYIYDSSCDAVTFYSIIQDKDNNYIIAGNEGDMTTDNGAGFILTQPLVLKLNNDGGLIWKKTYSNYKNANIWSLIEDYDGNYVTIGDNNSGGAWLLKLDKTDDGRIIWEKGPYWNGVGYCIIKTNSNGYAISGCDGHYRLLEFDNSWNIITNISYGNTVWGRVSVAQSNDGSFILAGTKRNNTSGPCYWEIMKFDSNGNNKWDKEFGDVNDLGGDFVFQMIHTRDDAFAVVGFRGDWDYNNPNDYNQYWVIKINNLGETVWSKLYGGNRFEYGKSIIETNDGFFLIAGESSSYGAGYYDAWIVKVDSKGNLEEGTN